jgi:hypothetical protein
MAHKRWQTQHDPEARPLGCNGKYGCSGRKRHQRQASPVCHECLASEAHYKREVRRGQKLGRRLHPCGTPAAARRHRYDNEPLDIPCQLAEAAYHKELRELSKTY